MKKVKKFQHVGGATATRSDHLGLTLDGSSYTVRSLDGVLNVVPAWMIEDSVGWTELSRDAFEILGYVDEGDSVHNLTGVRRLYDGEEFNVGDWYKDLIDGKGESRMITHIIRNEKERIMIMHKDDKRYTYTYTQLNNVEKVFPVCVSEDGVALFEGDDYCAIHSKDEKCIIRTGVVNDIDPKVDWILYFSTRKAAEEYRLNNVRVLCINDVITFDVAGCNLKEKLREFVKSMHINK